MSIHINGKKEDVASKVLLPGDPLRAKHIAETFLSDITCYSEVRGMYGFTGTYKGKRVSVQGSGMGQPSMGIYAQELISDFDVKTLIRVGSAGSLQENVKLRDLVLAQSVSTDSSFNKQVFAHRSFSPAASFDLLSQANQVATSKGLNPFIGNVWSSDIFYNENPDEWKLWSRYGALCVEMETTALYSLAAKFQRRCLSILTISDSLVTHEKTTPEERQNTFNSMVEIALELE